MKDMMDMTVSEALVNLRELGAGMSQHVIRDGDDKPLAAVIIIDGPDETAEVLGAIEELTRDW